MQKKRQHYIPESYLKAWCDSNTPKGQTPYVWMFSPDGRNQKKAPEKIFVETDLYTVTTKDGDRDLTIEDNLSRLESEFARIRKHKLAKHQRLTSTDRLWLCMFVIAMYTRTKKVGDHLRNNWQKALDMMKTIQLAVDQAPPERRREMITALSSGYQPDSGPSLSLDDVTELARNPLPSNVSGTVPYLAPDLFKIPFMVLEAPYGNSFVTSDAPCVWFDPAEYLKPPPYGAGGLISPSIEISLPVSPQQLLFFGKKLRASTYLPAYSDLVDILNRRTIVSADKYFVTNSQSIRQEWLTRSTKD